MRRDSASSSVSVGGDAEGVEEGDGADGGEADDVGEEAQEAVDAVVGSVALSSSSMAEAGGVAGEAWDDALSASSTGARRPPMMGSVYDLADVAMMASRPLVSGVGVGVGVGATATRALVSVSGGGGDGTEDDDVVALSLVMMRALHAPVPACAEAALWELLTRFARRALDSLTSTWPESTPAPSLRRDEVEAVVASAFRARAGLGGGGGGLLRSVPTSALVDHAKTRVSLVGTSLRDVHRKLQRPAPKNVTFVVDS